MQELPPLKPDLCDDIKLLSISYGYTSLYIKRSNILPQIGSSETGKFFTSFLMYGYNVSFFSSGSGKLLFLGMM